MNGLYPGSEITAPVPYVVHGSFRRHLPQIREAITTLNATGRAVAIAPHDCPVADEQDGFVRFAGEEDKDPRQIEAEYLNTVLSLRVLGGFSLWVAPDGYVGKSAAYEYGVAQASGVPSFFTEVPDDVPFYVNPHNVQSPERLAGRLLNEDRRTLLGPSAAPDDIGRIWDRLPFPTASVAVGGIVQYRKRLLLVEDGRWPNGQLAVPGTTVRPRETRDDALRRAASSKFGMDVAAVSPLKTSFMIDNSGYSKPVDVLVFDDRKLRLSGQHVRPEKGIQPHWFTFDEALMLAGTGQVEPNSAQLLQEYAVKA